VVLQGLCVQHDVVDEFIPVSPPPTHPINPVNTGVKSVWGNMKESLDLPKLAQGNHLHTHMNTREHTHIHT
jgi:hypothetical protein